VSIAYTMDSWAALLNDMAPARHIAPSAARTWMLLESGGNPAAVGTVYPNGRVARDADGNILESGLFQLYSPQEIRLAGTTVAKMRAGCSTREGSRAIIQSMVRYLTVPEAHEHIRAGLTFIEYCRGVAATAADAAHLSWSTADMWALTKLRHGLPVLINPGLPLVSRLLGRPPQSFDEFTSLLPAVTFNAAVMARRPYSSSINNAKKFRAGITPRELLNA